MPLATPALCGSARLPGWGAPLTALPPGAPCPLLARPQLAAVHSDSLSSTAARTHDLQMLRKVTRCPLRVGAGDRSSLWLCAHGRRARAVLAATDTPRLPLPRPAALILPHPDSLDRTPAQSVTAARAEADELRVANSELQRQLAEGNGAATQVRSVAARPDGLGCESRQPTERNCATGST